MNRVYRITDGSRSVFLETPLHLYLFTSGLTSWLGWLTLIAGELVRGLAKKLFQKTQENQKNAA